jgi:hypothetical protein
VVLRRLCLAKEIEDGGKVVEDDLYPFFRNVIMCETRGDQNGDRKEVRPPYPQRAIKIKLRQLSPRQNDELTANEPSAQRKKNLDSKVPGVAPSYEALVSEEHYARE